MSRAQWLIGVLGLAVLVLASTTAYLLGRLQDTPTAPEPRGVAAATTSAAATLATKPSATTKAVSTASAGRLTDIPIAFRGEFNAKLVDCGSDLNDSRLVINADHVNFYESSGPVTSVVRYGESEIGVTARLHGEGETWTSTFRFRLSADGERLADVTQGGPPFERHRCATAAPARQ